MDRRLFLTGLFGMAGATALSSVLRPAKALAGVPTGRGILDELDAQEVVEEDDLDAQAEPVRHRHGHHHHHHRRRRRRRRREWRRHCRRVWVNGYRRRRCRRRRVWVWYWHYY
jgi:hypothetical protein